MQSLMEDNGYVKILPYLEVGLPDPLAPDSQDIKQVKDIYSYFKEQNKLDPMVSFIEQFSKMPQPSFGQSKLGNMVKYISLAKLANKIKQEMELLGV